MGDVLKKFGRYFLLDHIAQGGMAEIYRARLASQDGAGRLIVIKKVIAGYGGNKEFLQMFKSEIKVTMGFSHPNIVQLFDFGEEEEQPYIAMEWMDGRNLRQFISRFQELKQSFPVDLAAHIVEQAASGLHYAHSFKDKITGESLNIVHRDISPQNILISFEGNVKVIDFGIAKATTNMESTRAGVIKGKPSYLSPEQISGENLDGRSDIFALGAVLWEMLTGKKLFAGENDLAVLKLIESCQTHVKPPSTLNPKVPKELDYIVLKTLAKQREKRYQTAEELQRALHKFLYSYSPDFNPSDLSYYAKDLFKSEIVEDRKKIQRLNDKAEQLIVTGMTSAPQSTSVSKAGATSHEENEPTTISASRPVSSMSRQNTPPSPLEHEKLEIEDIPNATKQIQEASRSRAPIAPRTRTTGSLAPHAPQRRPISTSDPNVSSSGKWISIGIAALLCVSLFGPEFGVRVPVLSEIFEDWVGGSEARLELQGNMRGVTVAINGRTVAGSLPTTLNGIPVGTPFRVTVVGPAGNFQQDIVLHKGERKSIPIILAQSGTGNLTSSDSTTAVLPEKSIYLRLNLSPGGGSPSIQVNGKLIDINNPVLAVPLDSPLELQVQRNGFKAFKREFVLDSHQVSGLKEWIMDVQLEPSQYGFLTIHTTPSAEATIMIDGSPWKKKTPLENEKIPIGEYSIRLTNDVLGMEKNVNVSIQEGRSINIDERLEIKN